MGSNQGYLLKSPLSFLSQVLEQTNNAKKVAEQKLGELAPKYTEMAGLNNTLIGAKTKLEKDLVAVRTEYTDIARELKLADERANKASHDAQHFEGTNIFWSSFSHLEPAVASMPPLLKNLHTLAKVFMFKTKSF